MGFLGLYLYGVVFLLPVFAGRAFGYDATQTGALFIPGSILTAMLMPVMGKLLQAEKNPKILIGIGLVFIELSLYLMTKLSGLSSRNELLVVLFARGVALAFLFVPINSTILSQFNGANLAQVSGLMNLFRQLGGSTGIAVVGTLLTQFSQQNYLDLSTHISVFNPATRETLKQLTGAMRSKMSNDLGMGLPNAAALRVIAGRIQAQVFMLSFNQLIWVMMAAVCLTIIPLLRLKVAGKTKVVDAH